MKPSKPFEELQSYLCSSPVTDYPLHNCPYYLITNASLGDDHQPGALEAILTQGDDRKQHHVIGYASQKLTAKEKNFTPF